MNGSSRVLKFIWLGSWWLEVYRMTTKHMVRLRAYVNNLSYHMIVIGKWQFQSLRPRQSGRHFSDDIFRCIFFNVEFGKGHIRHSPRHSRFYPQDSSGERPQRNPNWYSYSNWHLFTNDNKRLYIRRSKILEKRGGTNTGSAFIKPDQRNPWIKDQLGNALLSKILHLQLPVTFDLNNGITFATLSSCGKTSCVIDRFDICITGLIK